MHHFLDAFRNLVENSLSLALGDYLATHYRRTRDWTRLWLDVECESSCWAVGGYWECQYTAEVTFFEVPAQARLLVSEAWNVSRANNDYWSIAIFRVDRPDKLQITFGDQNLNDKSYSSSESQAAFRKNTFGDRKIRSTIDMSGAVT